MATLLHTTVRNYKVQGGISEVGCERRLWLSQHHNSVHNSVQVPRRVTNMKGNPIVFFNYNHSIVCMKYQVIRSSIGRLFSNHYDANEAGGHRKSSGRIVGA